jgi:hypothetical protein
MLIGGLDPDGNLLDPLMPRYDMDPDDFAALVAFLKRLETDLEPGLSDDAIRIGTLLPASGAYEAIGAATAATIRAYFDEINTAGGIFGRRLELIVADYAADPAESAANARRPDRPGDDLRRPYRLCGRVHLSPAVRPAAPGARPRCLRGAACRAAAAHVRGGDPAGGTVR